MRKQTYYGAIVLLALLVGGLAVTNQSLWIDEGAAALKAMEPSLGGWWNNLRTEGNSNLQLIGELFWLWGWAKIFGASEIALRASNIPFFAGGVVALAWGMGARRSAQTATVLLALTNAFLWYYLSEARPYIFLFGFAALTAACLFRLLSAPPEETLGSALWFRLFCAGVAGLCLTSLIAVPWAIGAMAAVVYWSGPRAAAQAASRCKTASGLTIATLSALGIYYLWTLQLGARASDVGRTNWSNIAYIFYELLGLAGLGPGRLDLRAGGAIAIAPFLPWVAGAAIAALVLLVAGFLTLRARLTSRHVGFFGLAVAGPFALVFAAGVTGHMRLVGRHLTPLLPYLLAWMGAGLAALFAATRWKKALPTGLILLFLLSALEIRLAPRHRRDDYRTAAALAREAVEKGGRVWWLADLSTGRYYHVPLDSPRVVTSPRLPSHDEPPKMVLLSKPDIYDSSGAVRAWLAAEGFRVARVLPAFQIWTRPTAR